MPELRSVAGRSSLPHLPSREETNRAVIQFITVTVHKRRPILANSMAVEAILAAWRKGTDWLVGRYVIMPDHLHLFCAPGCFPRTPLKRWVNFWKADATRRWRSPKDKPIWQKDFFDRQLRNGESYRQKADYIWQNPEVARFVANPEDWPYQGQLNPLEWHEPT